MRSLITYILDSERRDKCIDFIIMSVFFIFVFVITVWDSKTASNLFNSILFDELVNLVGEFGGSKF